MRGLLILSIALAGCSGSSSSGGANGTIGQQPFDAVSAALLQGDTSDPSIVVVYIGDFDNACQVLPDGSKQNSARVKIYLPGPASPGTYQVALPDSQFTLGSNAFVNLLRKDATCQTTTDDYASTGTVTVTASGADTITGSYDATSTTSTGSTVDHVHGSFAVSCTTMTAAGCQP